MSPEQKRLLEQLRELNARIGELYEPRDADADARSRGSLREAIQERKAKRRELVTTSAISSTRCSAPRHHHFY